MTDISSSSNIGNTGSSSTARSRIGNYSGMANESESTLTREDQDKRKFFNRRRSIITVINDFVQQINITIETAANVAEERCSRLNKSLHHLAEHNNQIID